jgi:hypothetical protein
MARFALGNGRYPKYAIVDDADAAWLCQWRWRALWNGVRFYAVRTAEDGSRRTIYMHREILKPGAGLDVDHANGDGLDNRRENLRPATPSQNSANFHRQSVFNSHGYRGVKFRKGRYSARCRFERRDYWLGTFDTAVEAARAYDAFIIEKFGPFARPNFPRSAA